MDASGSSGLRAVSDAPGQRDAKSPVESRLSAREPAHHVAIEEGDMRRLLAVIAVVFGIATLVTGGRVLLGADPGYVVYRPLLVFNTLMGAAYLLAGLLAWFDARRGWPAALAIFLLNALVLGFVAWLYLREGGVAVESARAMSLRTVVWLVLFLGLRWASARDRRREGRIG